MNDGQMWEPFRLWQVERGGWVRQGRGAAVMNGLPAEITEYLTKDISTVWELWATRSRLMEQINEILTYILGTVRNIFITDDTLVCKCL